MVETVDFHDRSHERSGALQIPKKTKVFVEQTIRERENAPGTAEYSYERSPARTNQKMKREIKLGFKRNRSKKNIHFVFQESITVS